MNDRWLDTETLEILQRELRDKLAPAKLPEYSVVMLEAGADRERMVRALRRINDCSELEARALLDGRLPRVINPDLSYHMAALAQFELVCCDAISVIIASEVIVGAEPAYLRDLFAKLRQSDEFQEVTLRLETLPSGEGSVRFLDQFLGVEEAWANARRFPVDLRMLYKKARIMTHWGNKIGAEVTITVSSEDE